MQHETDLKNQRLAFVGEWSVQWRIDAVEARIWPRLDAHVLLLISKPFARRQSKLASGSILLFP
jgi:hypothetical protein